MDNEIFIGEPPVEVSLRRSARARRFSLRVSRADGRVTLSLPLRASRGAAVDFARAQEGWLRQTLAELPTARRVVPGAPVLFEGVEIPVVAAPLRRARLERGALLVPPGTRAGTEAARCLQDAALQRLEPLCEAFAARLERRFVRIRLRDVRSRWGSCTSDGSLMFSWRLVMAPPEVLAYVAAHEVAHLVEMNHSPAFWALVERLMPGWRSQRDWLRQHGSLLQSYRFVP